MQSELWFHIGAQGIKTVGAVKLEATPSFARVQQDFIHYLRLFFINFDSPFEPSNMLLSCSLVKAVMLKIRFANSVRK